PPDGPRRLRRIRDRGTVERSESPRSRPPPEGRNSRQSLPSTRRTARRPPPGLSCRKRVCPRSATDGLLCISLPASSARTRRPSPTQPFEVGPVRVLCPSSYRETAAGNRLFLLARS